MHSNPASPISFSISARNSARKVVTNLAAQQEIVQKGTRFFKKNERTKRRRQYQQKSESEKEKSESEKEKSESEKEGEAYGMRHAKGTSVCALKLRYENFGFRCSTAPLTYSSIRP